MHYIQISSVYHGRAADRLLCLVPYLVKPDYMTGTMGATTRGRSA
jgi:hypothetical protein